MNLSLRLADKFNLLHNTVYFFKKHFAAIGTLGLIGALGRVIQLGGFGQITTWMNIALEVVVESSRVLLFLYVLGMANIKNGVLRIRHLFVHKGNWTAFLRVAIQKLKKQWFAVLLNIFLFLIIAWAINHLIDLLAYETCLYLSLKKDGILAESSSEWTILLFFKNLTVIPFTLIFDTVLLLWLSNKLSNYRKTSFA